MASSIGEVAQPSVLTVPCETCCAGAWLRLRCRSGDVLRGDAVRVSWLHHDLPHELAVSSHHFLCWLRCDGSSSPRHAWPARSLCHAPCGDLDCLHCDALFWPILSPDQDVRCICGSCSARAGLCSGVSRRLCSGRRWSRCHDKYGLAAKTHKWLWHARLCKVRDACFPALVSDEPVQQTVQFGTRASPLH